MGLITVDIETFTPLLAKELFEPDFSDGLIQVDTVDGLVVSIDNKSTHGIADTGIVWRSARIPGN